MSPSRVLRVGDGRGSVARALEAQSDRFVVTDLETPERGLDRLARTDVDCVVCELEPAASSMDGIEFARTLRARGSNVAFVLVVGPESVDRTSEALAAGVTEIHVRSADPGDGTDLATRIDAAIARADDSALASRLDLEAYRTVADHIADPMFVLDDEGVCVVVNDALLEYTGCDDRRRAERRPVEEFLGEDEYAAACERIESLSRDGGGRETFEMTVRPTDGPHRTGEVHVTPVVDDSGEYVGAVGVIRDVTEQQARIRDLERYEVIVETAPIGLLVIDEEGTITWHNEEFSDDIGLSGRDFSGTHFVELAGEGYFPNSTLEGYVERLRTLLSSETDETQLTYEEEWIDADGQPGITEVNMGLLPLEDGEFAGTIVAFRNISERVRNRRELERQNERLERFATLVSHDLRNPLNVVQGYLEVLGETDDDEAIEEARLATERMDELIDDLLALARYGRTVDDRERIDLADLAERAWDGVETADATLVADLDATITAHEGRIRELFENLFRNAVEHGGTDVTVTVGRLSDVGSGNGDTNGHTGFVIADDGTGLPDTDRLFEYGHTTADDGTGFGLAIVEEIADAHGWTLVARDGDDGGARFEFRDVTFLEADPAFA